MEPEEELIAVYKADYRYLRQVATQMLGHSRDSEDMVQVAFLNAVRWIASYNAKSSMRTWLAAIVRNVCRDHIRRSRLRHTSTLAECREFAAETIPTVDERMRQVHQEITKLSPRLCKTLIYYLAERTFGNRWTFGTNKRKAIARLRMSMFRRVRKNVQGS